MAGYVEFIYPVVGGVRRIDIGTIDGHTGPLIEVSIPAAGTADRVRNIIDIMGDRL